MRTTIAAILAALTSSASIAQDATSDAVSIDPDALVCSLIQARGVSNGESFIPEAEEQGFAAGPKVLVLPDEDDQVDVNVRGWVFWIEPAGPENRFVGHHNAFDRVNLDWFLTYTFFGAGNVPVTVSLHRNCAPAADLFGGD